MGIMIHCLRDERESNSILKCMIHSMAGGYDLFPGEGGATPYKKGISHRMSMIYSLEKGEQLHIKRVLVIGWGF